MDTDFDTEQEVKNITYIFSNPSGNVGMAYFYASLCLFGIPGNLFVLLLLTYILRKLTDKHKHMYVYLLSLCIVDSLVLLSLTLLITDVLLQHWIFGWTLCKIYTCVESFGKINSSFILTALSFDRFVAVCVPRWTQVRTVTFALTTITTFTLVSILLLGPLWINASPEEIGAIPAPGNITLHYTNVRCRSDMGGEHAFKTLTTVIFIVGFCLPASFIIFFYSALIYTIRNQSRRFARSAIPVKRVTGYTMMVVLFYFFCWTPFWIFNMLLTYGFELSYSSGYSTLYMVMLSLPQVNSSLNWIFYSFLNRQLRQSANEAVECHKRHERAHSLAIATESRASPSRKRSSLGLLNNNQKFERFFKQQSRDSMGKKLHNSSSKDPFNESQTFL